MPAKSKKQQKFFGIVRAIQKGKEPKGGASPAAKKAAKSMSGKDVKDFAKTNTKGLPSKVKKESFEARLDAILEGLDPKDLRKQDETPTVEVSKLDDPEDEEFEDEIPSDL